MPTRAQESSACRVPASAESAAVAGVIDERTLRLADGTEVRLAGLASLVDAGVLAAAEAAAAPGKAHLEALTLGKTIAFENLGDDRYGRRIALAAIAGGGGESLQERLIGQGHALVAARAGHPACAARLRAAEREARAKRLGLWGDPRYLIRAADRPAELAGTRGRFALVEGKVLSVNDRGATVYVNFGRRWSEDFTVTIAKRNLRSFTAAGLDPQRLTGRRVLIRGWVDERGGPWIEAIGPEQIELADRN